MASAIIFAIQIILGCLGIFLFLLYRKRKRETSVFSEMAIPGPQPHWFWGSTLLPKSEIEGSGRKYGTFYIGMHISAKLELIDTSEMDRFMVYHKWSQEYGKIFGYYDGPSPILVVSDLDFLQQVLIKQFGNFTARQQYPIQGHPDSDDVPFCHLFMARGKRWKRLRNIINPTFSASKLRQITVLINEKIKVMLGKLQDISDKKAPSDVQEVYQCLTLEVICDAAFGLNVDVQNNPNSRFLKEARAVFENLAQAQGLMKFAALFPEIRYIMYDFCVNFLMKLFPQIPEYWIVERFAEVIHTRRSQKINRLDLMQLLLDAETKEEELESGKEGNEEYVKDTKRKNNKALTDREVQDNCFLFFIAGYETTSSVLTYLTYLLATNPDKQQKLIEEVNDNFSEGEDVTYDSVMKLSYLDMCINETLRLYPVAASVVTRECTEPCTINGIHVPLGMTIQADVWSIHHDPDIWGPDSYEFEPDRFSPENKANMHPMQYLGFGAGPRNCVGMRFGLLEAKLAVVQMMKKFKFEKNELTEIPLTVKESGVIQPKNKLHVNVLSQQ